MCGDAVSYERVMEPIELRGLTIKNRVVRTAHFTNLGGGVIGDDTVAYHLRSAEGGVGLSFVEILSVHPSSVGSVNIFLPGCEDGYRKLVDAVRPTGMRLFQQIWHGGHNVPAADGGPGWSASDIPSPHGGMAPVAMTKAMIDEMVEAFASAAARCEEWGLDGFELHGCHGYLCNQFLSPATNKREDEYGGSFENRARFTIEVMAAMRSAVSDRMVCGIRVGDDATTGGATYEDFVALTGLLEERDLIDFVNISYGSHSNTSKGIPGMHEPAGYQLPTSRPIARSANVPAIVVGRFRTLREAEDVIARGDADMVGLTRAHIADPNLVAKSLAGREQDVRPCIGCNQGCLGGILAPVPRLGCVVNPAVGFERTMGDHTLQVVSRPKRVVVVGGGPAGMEAARVAAERGHRVVLFEAGGALGGTLNLAGLTATRRTLLDLTRWLAGQVERLKVDVRLGVRADVEAVVAEQPDEVIVATGSTPRMDGLQVSNPGEPIIGMDQARVVSSHQLLSGSAPLGRTAVVIDDTGHYEAVGVVEYLAGHGVVVTYVTPREGFAPDMDMTWMNEPALRRLAGKPVTIRPRTRAIAITEDHVRIGPVYLPADSAELELVAADTVVFISNNRPNRELYDQLSTRGVSTRVVGDAHTPRFLGPAVREGHLAGAAV